MGQTQSDNTTTRNAQNSNTTANKQLHECQRELVSNYIGIKSNKQWSEFISQHIIVFH